MRILGVLRRSLASSGRRLLAAAAANPAPVVFAGALLVASIGFAIAWLPLGFIFPGVTVSAMTFAWRWQMAFRKRGDD